MTSKSHSVPPSPEADLAALGDDEFLDHVFEQLVSALEDGIASPLSECVAIRPHLREALDELHRLASELAIGPRRHWPTVPGYRIIAELGRGGMGAVYLAHQERLGDRRVALKFLPGSAALSLRARSRFISEAHSLGRLHHPNVVPVFDVVEHEHVIAYSMEWIDGRSLGNLIADLSSEHDAQAGDWGRASLPLAESPRRPSRSSFREPSLADVRASLEAPAGALASGTYTTFICRTGISIARALSAVHAAGLLHRDVKPSNILLRRDGAALLSDFGLVRETDSTLTEPGQFAGTPAYASPEQLRGETDKLDARSDVYSVGVTLHHALALRLPYSGRTPEDLLRKIERGAFSPLRRANPRVPLDLQTIVSKCMDPDPSRRYQTADELADDLERLLSLQPIKARPAGLVTRSIKLARRKSGALLAATTGAALAAALLIALGIYLFQVPKWVAAHVREARLALLDPRSANDIVSVLYWGGIQEHTSEYRAQRRQQLDDALHEFNAALRLAPFDEEIRREMRIVQSVREGHSPPAQDERSLGLHAYLCGSYQQAIETWARWEASRDPLAHPDPLLDAALGVLYLFDDQPARAYPRLQKAVEAFPKVGFLLEYLADAAAKCGDVQRARKWLEESRRFMSRDQLGGGKRIEAGLLAAEGRLTDSITAYCQMGLQPVGQSELAALLERLGRIEQALPIYLSLAERFPQSPRIGARYRRCADQWWSSLLAKQRLAEIRKAMERPSDAQTLLSHLRAYAPATKPRSHAATKGIRHGEQAANQDLQRPHTVAESRGADQAGLSGHSEHAGQREVWADQPDSPSGGVGTVEHRGGAWPPEHSRLHPIPQDGPGSAHGVSNAVDSGPRARIYSSISGTRGETRGDRSGTPGAHPQHAAIRKVGLRLPPSWLRGSVAAWLFLRLFPALFDSLTAPSLQSLSLSELANRMEVEDMSLWNRIPSYPAVLKELHYAAWRWPMFRSLVPSDDEAKQFIGDARFLVSRRASAATMIVAAATLWVPFGRGEVVALHAGAADPAAEGWNAACAGLGSPAAGPPPAWRVNDRSSENGQYCHYWWPLTPAQLSTAHTSGWRLSATLNVLYGCCESINSGSYGILVGFRDNNGRYYDLLFAPSGNDLVMQAVDRYDADPNLHTVVSIPDGAADWVEVEMIYRPGQGADVYIDGVLRISNYQGALHNYAPASWPIFGAPSSPAQGEALFANVRFEVGCTAAPCFQGLGDLPGGNLFSAGYGLSADGSTVVGSSSSTNGTQAFRWRADTGMVGLGALPAGSFESQGFGVSGDGSVVVGWSRSSAGCDAEAYRWTAQSGLVGLGFPSGCTSYANGISDDASRIAGGGNVMGYYAGAGWSSVGSMVGGYQISRNGQWIVGPAPGSVAARWSTQTGVQILGDLPGGPEDAFGQAAADNGTVVGLGHSANGPEAFVWTPAGGMAGLGDLTGGAFESYALGISADSRFIIGYGSSSLGWEAVLWDETRTLHRIADFLSDHDVVIPAGWTLRAAYEMTINADEVTLCGMATNPQGNPEAWIARFTLKPAALPGDMNCDGVLSVSDIAGFVLALTNPAGYAAQFPNCNINNADMNQDDNVSVSDIGPFVQALTGG